MSFLSSSDIADYDFGEDDAKVQKTQKPRKRKEPEIKTENIGDRNARESKNFFKRRKKNVTFEINLSKSLEKQIQEWIDKEWKNCMWIKCKGLEIRETSRKMLKDAFLKEIPKEKIKMVEFTVHIMEQIIYDNWFIYEYNIYARRIRNLCNFIQLNPSRFLEIDPSYSATMNDKQLADYRDKGPKHDHEEFMKKNIYGEGGNATCRRCKKQNVDYFTIQLRGADEPATEFFTCKNCGHNWREN